MALLGLSIFLLVVTGIAVLYWYLLVAGAMLPETPQVVRAPRTRFAVLIPAHNEEDVIAATVRTIHAVTYPKAWIKVYVLADHCTDSTAEQARAAGAVVLERETGEREGKGAAMAWLLQQVFALPENYDAVAVFDADSRVDSLFFQAMDSRLQSGAAVVQGNHIIANPYDSGLSALTWVMFLIDNRLQNFGRSQLGFSAKHMGDAICFRSEILQAFGWGKGLAEDYALRQALLLKNIRIAYAQEAKSFGQAAWNWQTARQQRLRWLRGARAASAEHRAALWKQGWRDRSPIIIEGALQSIMPSYSTLSVITAAAFLAHAGPALAGSAWAPSGLTLAWAVLTGLLFAYPFLGLALERAPARAYRAILTGPVFIVWRTWLRVSGGRGEEQHHWVRTPHRRQE